MKTSVIIQPDNVLGDILKELLSSQSPSYKQVWIISAFANRTGIEHLASSIQKAKDNGTEVHITVGIDFQLTTLLTHYTK